MFEYHLNKAQIEAVEHTDGPLLIVAGAGTGKTTVITNKIGYLIDNGIAKPEEILALTFTDKAASEMQERVDRIISLGYSELTVSTFHAFCQKILEKHAIDIGLSNQFKLLTETGSWLLIQKNFHKFNLDYYRPLGNPHRHIHGLAKHFAKCKDELICPEEYLEYAEGLKFNSDNAHSEEKDLEINRLTELANAYHAYNQLLLDNSAMDFADLIYYSIKLLKERPLVLKSLQNRYKYILVDEFQDVNWAQYQLVRLLAGERANLTVVGDDDQSIYAFRGASVSNIMRFKDDYSKTKNIILTENYRSEQEILDLAYKSIQNNNPDRLEVKLEIDKRLSAKRKAQNVKRKMKIVEHIHSDSIDGEAKSVVEKILELRKTDKTATWDDFAILVRANSHADPFISELERQKVPYEYLSSSGLYRQPIVLDCVNFFKLINNYHESAAIYRLLCLPFLKFKENDLQKITSQAKKKSISYYEAIKTAPTFGISLEGIEAGNKLIETIHNGLRQSREEKPTTVLLAWLEEIGYLKYLTQEEAVGNAEVIGRIYHLQQFFEYLREYETITPDAKVTDFLDHFLMMVEAGDRGELSQPSDTPDSVNILTAHGAKGLEFKYVFVVNLVEERFPSRSRPDAIEIPTELIKEQLPEGDSHYQEERRLFYVAMTRAKAKLFLTSANDYGGVKTKKISRFLAEIGFKSPEEKKKKVMAQNFVPPQPDQTTEAKFVYEVPKLFSYSQIKSYETCPYQYKLAHILKIPIKGNASFSFGITIHSTLQTFYNRILELNSVSQESLFAVPEKKSAASKIKVPTLDELLSIYEKSWIPDWYKNQAQREEYFDSGKKILKTFYANEQASWTIPLGLECWFKIKIDNYLVQGRIDRIDKLPDNKLEIIDYKTGRGKDKLSAEDKEQLLVYQIAAQELKEYKDMGLPGKLTFYYLNDNKRVSFLGEEQEIAKLKDKFKKIMESITGANFKATPSKFVCDYCDFKDICDYRV